MVILGWEGAVIKTERGCKAAFGGPGKGLYIDLGAVNTNVLSLRKFTLDLMRVHIRFLCFSRGTMGRPESSFRFFHKMV